MTLLRLAATGVKAGVFPAAVGLLGQALPAQDQERPFATPRAWVLESGAVRLESGLRLTFDRRLPLSGLSGDLLEVQAGVGVGLGGRVEGRLEGVAWQRMAISRIDSSAALAGLLDLEGDTTRDAGDLTLGTRVRLTGGVATGLATAVQVAVRLPNAGNESGLGRDVTDAFASLLAGWRGRSFRVSAEAGLAILGSPTRPAAQNDQGRLGLAVELEPAGKVFAVGAEARTSFGDEGPGNELATELTGGARLRIGSIWADLAYYRFASEGRCADGFQVGLSRVF